MSKTQAAASPKTAAKPVKADIVTLRHLATEVAEAHGMSQKQANEVLAEAITSIGKHLKKGAEFVSPDLERSKYVSGPRGWAVTQRQAKRSRSRPAKRSLSAPRKT